MIWRDNRLKNKLSDLNNHLFMVLERLNDEDITGEKLNEEMARADAITKIAKSITSTADILLEAKKHFDEYGIKKDDLDEIPEMLRICNANCT